MKHLHHALIAAAAALGLSDLTHAQMVPVQWDAQGQFAGEFRVEPGKFLEACEKLPRGTQVAWHFDATSPLDFNIHYHEGKKVLYPARHDGIAASSGTLDARLEQDYCWMWTNKSGSAATLKLQLKRR